MLQKLDRLKESPSQTAGPYVHIGLTPNFSGIGGVFPSDLGQQIAGPGALGTRITITGRVLDGTGTPLRDALLELWQADSAGRYAGQEGADPEVSSWGRCATDMETGVYTFETVKPGPVPTHMGGLMAPHVSLWIVARGINLGLSTRAYFDDEDNSADPVLARIEHQVRVPTLIAKGDGAGTYTFDIHLQGPNESIFFDL
ncbi:MAG: protocatechuate 3,4-dioxygenase subunit alpha [Pseudomonadota bacterium]